MEARWARRRLFAAKENKRPPACAVRPTQVKVMTERDLLALACEQFLGKSVTEIKAVVLQTLEGHLRSILGARGQKHLSTLASNSEATANVTRLPCLRAGTLTVEQIYQDRDRFAQLVREVASPDVGRMGIEILSFTIKVGRGSPAPAPRRSPLLASRRTSTTSWTTSARWARPRRPPSAGTPTSGWRKPSGTPGFG